jgi:hypothetical protein
MDQLNNGECSPVLLPNEQNANYVGYKILNIDGSFSNPTNIPQMTLRSKSINNAMNIIQNGNNSNIPLETKESFYNGSNEYNVWNMMGDIGIQIEDSRDIYLFSEKYVLVSFGILFGIIYLWKKYKK